jgi:hypothetical protein
MGESVHQLDKLDSLEAMESAVNEALEAARSGQNFAASYGDGSSRNFRRSSKWVVRIKGVAIDSKPLVAAAYKYQFGHELSQKLHGGSEVLVSALARFGYHLEPRGADSGPVARRPDPWVTSVGEVGSKKDFAKLYGGSTMGGIQPSGQTNNILIYSDPAVGTTHGYNFDGWTSDGETYSYTGEGQYGPQTLQGGNGAILNHRSQGRSLRLFVSDGYIGKTRTKKRIYVGEFVIDEGHPYSVEDALDNDHQMRTVYVFHLKPVGEVVRRPQDYSAAPMTPKSDAVAEKVPLENHLVSEFETSGSGAVTAEKREQALVANFQEVLVARGHELSRWKITPPESTRPLYSDLFDETTGTLYEAKAKSTRNHVRMGLGQILDYKRYTPLEVKDFALLLPAEPHADLLDLLRRHGLGAIWPDAQTGRFVKLADNGFDPF